MTGEKPVSAKNIRHTVGKKLNGPGYLLEGFQLLFHPRLRLLVLTPLVINLLVFIGLSIVIVDQFSILMNSLMSYLPEWLEFLAWIVWVLFALLVLVIYGYSFALVGNLLASPFYGLLAEKVSALENPDIKTEPLTFNTVLAIAGRSFKRELHKLLYFLPRIVAVLLLTLVLSFIPPFSLLSPVIIFLWGAWSLALQYLDCGADNSAIEFISLRQLMATRKFAAISFGGSTLLATSIPILNLLAIPASVIGATIMWERQVRERKTG